jgi:hypothetical protein
MAKTTLPGAYSDVELEEPAVGSVPPSWWRTGCGQLPFRTAIGSITVTVSGLPRSSTVTSLESTTP